MTEAESDLPWTGPAKATTSPSATKPTVAGRDGAASPGPAGSRATSIPTLTAPAPVPVPTASTWATLLTGGTVSTTAAAPSITATPTAVNLARGDSPPPALAARSALSPAPALKTVYLTFDDGPSSKYTLPVLALLQSYNAKATFFVIGRQTTHAKATLRAEYAAGHGIGNHTWDHRSLRRIGAALFTSEVERTQRAIQAATGHAAICLRPPGGSTDESTRARAKLDNLRLQFWTIDTGDWSNPGSATIARRALHHVHNGSVILLHDGGGQRTQTVRALKVILETLAARGYSFGALCR